MERYEPMLFGARTDNPTPRIREPPPVIVGRFNPPGKQVHVRRFLSDPLPRLPDLDFSAPEYRPLPVLPIERHVKRVQVPLDGPFVYRETFVRISQRPERRQPRSSLIYHG
jgi:hypothetical protein